MSFIIAKNMPDKIIYKLETCGKVYLASYLDIADKSVGFHPDIQIHFVDKNIAFCPPEVYRHFRDTLPETISLKIGISSVGITYPENCAYNIGRVGNNIICNRKISERKIIDYYTLKGFNIVDVKQGYAKCNIAPVSDNLFITEDKGIYQTAISNNINCLIIPSGDVALEGFKYGFIGGATGFYNNTLLLCGKAPEQLKKVLEDNYIDYIELSNDKLTDYGSIISF